MAVIVPFEDIVRSRRRQRERLYTEHCIALIQSTIELALQMFDDASPAERPVYARRVRQLSELLEYAVRTL